MTRDDIIRMAREARMLDFSEPSDSDLLLTELERFATLAAAAERERIACEFDRRAVYDDGTPSSGWYEPHEPAEIVRAMRPKADVQPQRQQKAGDACARKPA